MEIDVQRKRIGLTMRLEDESRDQVKDMSRENNKRQGKVKPKNQSTGSVGNSAMADALAQAFKS